MINLICKSCGSDFSAFPSDIKKYGCRNDSIKQFCSKKCRSKFAHDRRKEPLTQKVLHSLIDYRPETGEMFWKVKMGRCEVGERAGCLTPQGYYRITIYQNHYAGHHLAWLYVYGYFPENIDHKNNQRHDNRIENIREATTEENSFNRRIQSNNKIGFKGVTKYENIKKKKYRAQITKRGKVRVLGYFYTAEEAHAAYVEAGLKLHGEFFNSG